MKKLKNETDVELTDENGETKVYKLRYDLNALADFEEIYDKGILEIFAPSIDDEGRIILDQDGMPVNLNFRVGMLRRSKAIGCLLLQEYSRAWSRRGKRNRL